MNGINDALHISFGTIALVICLYVLFNRRTARNWGLIGFAVTCTLFWLGVIWASIWRLAQ